MLMALCFPGLAAAQASAYCPTVSRTVVQGGTVVIDVSNCDGLFDFGLNTDPNSGQPAHGTSTLSAVDTGGAQTVTYTHNGDLATADTFYFLDEDNNTITFNITITPALSASIAVSPASLNEDSGNAFTYTVTLSQTSSSATTVNLSRSGTATSGTDYTGAVNSVVVPANATTASFAVTPVADSFDEPDETVTFTVVNGTGYAVGSPAIATATIVDDDAPPALSIDDISVNEGNSGTTTATFTVSLSAASGQTVSVNYATADGTATAGSDYVARSGTLTFAPGVTAQGVAITVNGDTAVEPNETFSVGLSGASNASIASATGTGTINNDDAVVTVGPASLPSATAGSVYNQTLTASGGTAPYSFVVSAGALPAGLTLSAAGVLSGTPSASGTFNFNVTATDSGGSPTSGSRAYTLVVASPTITLPATTLAGGTAGQAYTAAINPASGGIAPYTYTLTAGALPAGVTVSSGTGALSGTPTVAGTFAFTLTATDSTTGTAGQGSQSYSVSIVSPTLTVAPPTLPAGTAGTAYSQTLSASGGTAPYTYAVTAGALPAGLNLSTGGALSGTPTVAGNFNFTVTATDAGSFGAAQAYTLAIAAPTLTIAPPTLPGGTVGTAYSQTLSASGGTAPYSFAVTAGTLPAGLALDGTTGVLSGTPTSAGNFAFTVTATDASAFTAATAYTLAVAVGAANVAAIPTLGDGGLLLLTALLGLAAWFHQRRRAQ